MPMTVTTIQYSESHESITPEGLKKWNKIGLEANVAEGENVVDCYKELQGKIREMRMSTGEMLSLDAEIMKQAEYRERFNNIMYPHPKESRIQSIIQEINNCTSLDEKNKYGQQIGLLAYEQAAKDNEEVGAAYESKLQQFKNQ